LLNEIQAQLSENSEESLEIKEKIKEVNAKYESQKSTIE